MARYRVSIDLSDFEADIRAIADIENRSYSQTIRLLLKAAINNYKQSDKFRLGVLPDAE